MSVCLTFSSNFSNFEMVQLFSLKLFLYLNFFLHFQDIIVILFEQFYFYQNVASEVANKLCESVALKLEGSVCGTFQSVQSTVKESMTESLLKLLTPKRRIDIIRDVMEVIFLVFSIFSKFLVSIFNEGLNLLPGNLRSKTMDDN